MRLGFRALNIRQAYIYPKTFRDSGNLKTDITAKELDFVIYGSSHNFLYTGYMLTLTNWDMSFHKVLDTGPIS